MLTPQHICAFPKQGMHIHRYFHEWSFPVLCDLRSEVIIRFVDIGRIVDYRYRYACNCSTTYGEPGWLSELGSWIT
jgi:hypothetical protein